MASSETPIGRGGSPVIPVLVGRGETRVGLCPRWYGLAFAQPGDGLSVPWASQGWRTHSSKVLHGEAVRWECTA